MRRLPPRSHGSARGFLTILIGLPLVGLVLVALPRSLPPATPIYSVAALRAGLARQPAAWLGRPFSVSGVADEECAVWLSEYRSPPCPDRGPTHLDQSSAGADGSILLGRAAPSWLQAHMGSIPVLGALIEDLDPPRTIHWGARAVYRVEIVAIPTSPDAPGVEYEVLLL